MTNKKMLFAFCFLSFVASGNAKEYFVSPTGNDANTCTIESPWKLVNNSIKKIKSGDILYVPGGTYNEKIYIAVSGTSSANINISAYSSEIPVIDGSTLSIGIWTPLVQIVGSDVHMSGIEVRNSKGRGIAIDGAHTTLSNLNVHHNWMEGIWTLNEKDVLSPGQNEEIDRVYKAYPHLNDDAFVADNLDRWLA